MTEPDERLPRAGTAEPSGERDPERLEALAEEMGIDPSPQQVDAYREALGDDGTPEQV
jgi:DNA-binding SARP family transcriptional activator